MTILAKHVFSVHLSDWASKLNPLVFTKFQSDFDKFLVKFNVQLLNTRKPLEIALGIYLSVFVENMNPPSSREAEQILECVLKSRNPKLPRERTVRCTNRQAFIPHLLHMEGEMEASAVWILVKIKGDVTEKLCVMW